METKCCKMCKENKSIDSFFKSKKSKDRLSYNCKKCSNIVNNIYRNNNKNKVKEWSAKYSKNNKNKKREYSIVTSKKCSKCNEIKLSENFYRNKMSIDGLRSSCNDCGNKLRQKYRNNNKEKVRNHNRNYINNRRLNDPIFKMKESFRRMIRKIFIRNGFQKSKNYNFLGCSYADFKILIESKFESWMSWENYGKYNGELNYGWDIDHIIPLSSASSEEDVIKLNHYSNLQPLCSKINRDIKRDLIDYLDKYSLQSIPAIAPVPAAVIACL